MSRFTTLSANSRMHARVPAATAQKTAPIPSPISLSRFGTLSDKSRASLHRPPPAQPAPQAPPSEVSYAPLSSGISVDEAWALFGITKKRATREEVKARYLKLIAKYHPDKNMHDL